MKRMPSLHILKCNLEDIIKELGPITLDNLDIVMARGRKISIENRSLQINETKKSKETARRLVGSIGDANLLADLIYSVRIKLKHVGVTKIKQTDSQWANIKELTQVINDFCVSKGLEQRAGYIKYITIGLKLLATSPKPNYTYCAKWMIQKASWIISEYDNTELLRQDSDKKGTLDLYNCYITEVAERTGIYNYFSDDTTKMVCMLKARELSDNYGADYETFIKAQFTALEFCGGIPRPQDLYGDKASERLIKYVGNNGITLESHKEKNNIDWNQFKK